MLTAPTAARPNVHLLNFIYSSDVVLFLFTAMSGVKTVYPSTLQVRLISKLGKNAAIDNNFFS